MYQAAGGSDTGWMVEQNSGWLGKLEVDGSGWGWMGNYPPVDGEDDVNRLGTSLLEVDEVGVGGWGGLVDFQIVVRIPYDGFLWGFGVETRVWVQSPGRTILECSREGGY